MTNEKPIVGDNKLGYEIVDIAIGPPGEEEPGNEDQLTPEQIATLKSKDPEKLTAEEKEQLEKITGNTKKKPEEAGDPPPSEEEEEEEGDNLFEDITEEEIEALQEKPEEELTDEEKEFLTNLNKEPQFMEAVFEATGFKGIQDKKYSEDTDGLTEYAKDFAQALAQQQFAGIVNANPLVKDFYESLKAGQSPQQYAEMLLGYSKANVELSDETSDSQLEDIIKSSWTQQGYKPQHIENLLSNIRNEGKLLETAQEEAKVLEGLYKEELDAIEAENKAAEQARVKQSREFWTKASEVIKDGDLGGARIPDDKKDVFFRYLTERDENGYTAKDKKKRELSVQDILKIEWAIFSDFKGISSSSKKPVAFADLGGNKNGKNRQSRVSSEGGGQPPAKNVSLKSFTSNLRKQEARAQK